MLFLCGSYGGPIGRAISQAWPDYSRLLFRKTRIVRPRLTIAPCADCHATIDDVDVTIDDVSTYLLAHDGITDEQLKKHHVVGY